MSASRERQLWFTTFPAPARWTTQGRFEPWTWVEVLHHVRTPELWPGSPTIAASEAQLPGWTFARYADDCRVASDDPTISARETAARVREVWGLCVEYIDDPAVDPSRIERWWGPWQYAAYTTAWHLRDMGEKPAGPRWRVMIPFTRAASLAEAIQVGEWARSPHRDAGIVDGLTARPWRYYAVPAVVPGGYRWEINEGRFLDPSMAIAELERWEAEDRTRDARRKLQHTTIGELARRGFLRPTSTWDAAHSAGTNHHQVPAGALLPAVRPTLGRTWPRLFALAGASWPGRIAVVVGPQGSGRTAFALQVAEGIAREGAPVLLAPTAMGSGEVAARMLALRAGEPIDYSSLLAGAVPREDLAGAVEHLSASCPNLHVWIRPHAEHTPAALALAARAMAQGHDGRAPVLVVDDVPLPGRDPEWWGALLDMARPQGLGPEWPGAVMLVVCPLPPRASIAFSDPEALLAWTEHAARRATALEELDLELARLADQASLVLGLTVDSCPDMPSHDAIVAILANRHGRRGAVPFTFHPARGLWVEGGTAIDAISRPGLVDRVRGLLTGPVDAEDPPGDPVVTEG